MMNTSQPFPPGSCIVAYLRDSGGERQELSTGQQEAEIRAWWRGRLDAVDGFFFGKLANDGMLIRSPVMLKVPMNASHQESFGD